MESWLLEFQGGKRAEALQEDLLSILIDGMNQIEALFAEWRKCVGI